VTVVTTVISRFATKEPTVCAVCRRHAVALGYVPHYRQPGQKAPAWPSRAWGNPQGPTIWLCDHNGCHAASKKVYAMPNEILDAYEIGAALEAGAEAGGYLDEIGKFDLRTLDAGEWREFLRRVLVGFEHVMRRKILNNEAPF
jgi:hypothetical protein